MCSFPSAGDFQPVVWKPERIEVNPANNESNGLLYFFLLKEDSHLLFVQLSSCLKNVAVGDSTRNNICGWSLMAWSKGVKTGNTSVLDHVLHAKSLQPARKFHKVPCTNLISSLTLNEQKKQLPLLTLSPKQVVLPAYRPTVTKRGGLRTSKSCNWDWLTGPASQFWGHPKISWIFTFLNCQFQVSGIYVSLKVHLYNQITLSEWQD